VCLDEADYEGGYAYCHDYEFGEHEEWFGAERQCDHR